MSPSLALGNARLLKQHLKIARFCNLPDGQEFKLTAGGRTLTKQGDGFTTSWGARVRCNTPYARVIVVGALVARRSAA